MISDLKNVFCNWKANLNEQDFENYFLSGKLWKCRFIKLDYNFSTVACFLLLK